MNNAGWQFSREEVNTSSGQGRPRQGPVSHTARGAGQGDRAAVGTCQLSQLGSRPRWSRGGCARARGACGTWTQLSPPLPSLVRLHPRGLRASRPSGRRKCDRSSVAATL